MPVRHVLVVDDSKSARLMLRKMLQGFGMTVDTAESGEEAINYLRDRQPDAIFMDHTMPGMDGLMALRQIKNNPATAAIPVAMYTSRDEANYREEARVAGAIDVLTKPAIPEILGVLLERMHQMLDAAPVNIPAPAVVETANVAWVEKIVVDKAESVFYDAIESQVLPLLNDVIAKLRREIEAGQTTACSQIATKICDERLAKWQPTEAQHGPQWTEEAIQTRLSLLLDERLEAFRRGEQESLQRLVQDMASQVCQSQLHELSERLVRQLSARFTEAVQKSASTARDAAVEAAREAALKAVGAAAIVSNGAHDTRGEVAEKQADRQRWVDVQRGLLRHIYLAAAGAAATGIGAAALVYGLR
jgi:CheY-like chemotaxis protein